MSQTFPPPSFKTTSGLFLLQLSNTAYKIQEEKQNPLYFSMFFSYCVLLTDVLRYLNLLFLSIERTLFRHLFKIGLMLIILVFNITQTYFYCISDYCLTILFSDHLRNIMQSSLPSMVSYEKL